MYGDKTKNTKRCKLYFFLKGKIVIARQGQGRKKDPEAAGPFLRVGGGAPTKRVDAWRMLGPRQKDRLNVEEWGEGAHKPHWGKVSSRERGGPPWGGIRLRD